MSVVNVLMTTHKVVIDADDETHARFLREALRNDGYRVRCEVRRMVSCDGAVTIECEALSEPAGVPSPEPSA
jgi:hypothetical protein